MKSVRILFALLLLPFTACESGPVDYPPLTFTRYQPIHFAVSSIEVVDVYQSPQRPPNVEHLIPYSPSEAMHIWVKDRLHAMGGNRYMQVIIRDASVVASPVQETGLMSWSPIQSTRYDARLAVEIRVYEEGVAMSRAAIQAQATRSITISDEASLGTRDAAFRDMIGGMMTEFNAELEKDIFAYLGKYISYTQ